MKKKSLSFPPGDEHPYSNSGYLLSGIIVKRVSGRSLNEFTQERIFLPLGMKNTQYLDGHTRIEKNLRFVYINAPDENLEAMARDKFIVGRFNLESARNEDEKSTCFILGAGRAANIKFIKKQSENMSKKHETRSR